ncbi:MAG TPA: DUF362 domain-containing protein [Verrucomicrobiota bacterium]|nr:DUF362 domain-containing protein [Verrucomicrobiota bacterium]HRV39023.1 DUF362 domain-containing protein [Candidatus Paceibacterota bacterium]NLH84178.1 DUF362 domain-containing protein [Verrucomicrobiota bacterium]HOM46741.1 DUF362 domain-containing protein [Verrucomicrobiota bacterium]HOQ57249.1 DUF362 domain-containing protein [Verrucomicrobiota bacterium]
MSAKRRSTSPAVSLPRAHGWLALDRRAFLRQSLACVGGLATGLPAIAAGLDRGKAVPLGVARGIHPGRVVWAHDPEVTTWKGPDDGHWWEGNRVKLERVEAMLARAVCELTGETTVPRAWSRLFRHLNQARGKGDVGYRAGEQIVIKPNWVGMIFHEGNVNLDTYAFIRRQDYMNTAPQMILALLDQLVRAGVAPRHITICDTLACLVPDYYDRLHGDFPAVRYEDYAGKFERAKVRTSTQPLYWSSRPEGKAQDYLPASFADAEYLINFANLKAHTGGGVTLCAKNHYGSLVRWPAQKGYYDIHPNCFSRNPRIYRPLVDLTGHSHLGGKTVLYLVDGLFSGVHPRDPVPQRMRTPPFNGQWSCSLLASQDPLAIDSVGFDFLAAEWPDLAGKDGVDDYLHEAALAPDPPSGTFYDPNHDTPTRRLPSLGVHEHWNNPRERKYSRNLGTGDGIELVSVKLGARPGK